MQHYTSIVCDQRNRGLADDNHKTWANFAWKKNKHPQSHNNEWDTTPLAGDDALGTIRGNSTGVTSEYNMMSPAELGDGRHCD